MVKRPPDARPLDATEIRVLETFFRQGSGWLANPAAVSREGRVVRTTAGKVCENLAARGFLERKMTRSKNKSESSPHYRLKAGPKAFYSVALAYFSALRVLHGDHWSGRAWILDTKYAREELTPDLVRAVLLERKVGMSLGLDAPAHLIRERDVFAGRAHRTFFLTLPLAAKTGLNAETMARDVIREAASRSDPLEPAAEAFLEGWVLEHYRTGELQRLILPILALCEVSPRALETFLTPWKPHDMGGTSGRGSGFPSIDHVVFRMVFDAVADLADARDVPAGGDVTFAEVCPEHGGVLREGTLLQLTWKYEAVIGYAAGFDTDHMYYGGGEDDYGIEAAVMSGKPPEEWTVDMLFGTDGVQVVESVRNPENAWVRVAWGKPANGALFNPEVTDVERALHYVFNDRSLLSQALTHSTLNNEKKNAPANQRLAHLGDAVAELVVREALFRRFPSATKRELTDRKKRIVSDEALAGCARKLELGKLIAGGRGLTPEQVNDTVLAEAFEALLGAIFLDADFERVCRIVERTVPLPVPA